MRYAALSVLVGLSTTVFAQYEPTHTGEGRVTVLPVYQSWFAEDFVDLSQFSTTVLLQYLYSRDLSFSIQSGQANTSGDVTDINGFTDTQLSIAYRVESAHVVLTLGCNLPSGKHRLTQEEFELDTVLSKEVFELRHPRYGQGININPGIIWAIPISNNLVLAVGAGYQYLAPYVPHISYGEYDPGDEWMVSAGIEARLDEASTFSADIIFSSYDKDKFEGFDVYDPGDMTLANLRYQRFFGYNELSFLVHYRHRDDGKIALGNTFVDNLAKANPDVIEALGQFRLHFSSRMAVGFQAGVRSFQQESSYVNNLNLFGVGVEPEFRLTSAMSLLAVGKFQTGELDGHGVLTGWEIGAGLTLHF